MSAIENSVPAAASSSSPVETKKDQRTPLSPASQSARDAAAKLKPCFDLAESGACPRGDACKFSHDSNVLATAATVKEQLANERQQRQAEREATKEQRAAAKIERDAKQAVEKLAREEAKKKAAEERAAAAKAKADALPPKQPKQKKQPPTIQQDSSASVGAGAGAGVQSPTNGAKQKRSPKSAASISVGQPPASPAILPNEPQGTPDLTHILVRQAISSKYKSAPKLTQLKNKPFIIGITGGTASGKTTVCNELQAKLGKRVAMLQMDRFYFSLPHDKPANQHNFDVPEAFDWVLFADKLKDLSTGVSVEVPQYSFETHQRLPKLDVFEPAEVIMVEGILTLHDPRIYEQFDLKVFIEADSDVRLARRIVRDIAERGRTVEGVIDQYINTVKPAHERYIQPSARQADIIVPHNGPKNGIAIDLLAQHISTEIYKRGASLAQPQSKKNKNNSKKANGTARNNPAASTSSPSPPLQPLGAPAIPVDANAAAPQTNGQAKPSRPPKTSGKAKTPKETQ